MTYGYPDWSEKDAKSGVYGSSSVVAYKSLDGIERVYRATISYVGGIRPPDVEVGWEHVDTVIYDWNVEQAYKIGSIVRYNNLQYIATRRYRGGSLPPNEELDPEGIRTWMINYIQGAVPVTPFFYMKQFGFKNFNDVHPFGNYLEDISWAIDTVGPKSEGVVGNEYGMEDNIATDRFRGERTYDADGNYADVWQSRPEQNQINSVMEAEPYSDIYITGFNPPSIPPYVPNAPYQWYTPAKHKSETRDKLYPLLWLYGQDGPSEWSKYGVPKRNIPYFDGNDIERLKNGTSLEYYPHASYSNYEIIMSEHGSGAGNALIDSINALNPLSVFSSNSATPSSPIILIYIETGNVCVDSVTLTLYFNKVYVHRYTEKVYYTEDDYSETVISGQPIRTYFERVYRFDGENRGPISINWSDELSVGELDTVSLRLGGWRID